VTVPVEEPTGFELVEPAPAADVPREGALFDWTPSFDPDTGDEAAYDLRLALSPEDPSTWVVFADLATSERFVDVVGALESVLGLRQRAGAPADAYWTVVARNGCEEREAPEWRTLTVDLTPPAVTPTAFAIRSTFPTPARGASTIAIAVPRDGRVRVRVYDLHGRRVQTVFAGDVPAGLHEWIWDGTGGRGERVASGVYLVRAEFEGRAASRRIVLVR
jgi:hypothetical protein